VVVSHSGTALAKAYRGFASELAADLPASAVAEPDRGNGGLFGWLRPRPAPVHA
jgi:hypothetical protein